MGLRRRCGGSCLWASALIAGCSANTITFLERLDGTYDTAPKLRIRGSGFDNIDLTTKLHMAFLPKLTRNIDYNATVQSDEVLMLQLLPGKRWAPVETNSDPKALYITKVTVDNLDDGGDQLTDGGIQVAQVLPTPTIQTSERTIFRTATPRLVVNGTSFNTKRTELYFDPPLKEGTDFTMQIISSTQIALIKKYQEVDNIGWREDAGPLRIIAINTGGGRLPLSPETGGQLIAQVEADLEGHAVTVQTQTDQFLYQSSPSLIIKGTGFNPQSTVLRFSNNLRGQGTNYTATSTTEDTIELKLAKGSVWRANPESLPGPLVLLAADAGAGFVPLGPTTAKSGRVVATIYEDPSVKASKEEIYRTTTHVLTIEGEGFNDDSLPLFEFDTPLAASADYYVEVVSRTKVNLHLITAWKPEDALGDLKVKSLDTGAGKVTFTTPVTVAKVIADTDLHASGISISPSHVQTLYQSQASQKLVISGTGFSGTPNITFSPTLKAADYTLTVVDETTLELLLKSGKKWRTSGGALVAMKIQIGKDTVSLGGGDGIKVATILSDPKVTMGELRIYAGHTKHFTIKGSGFLSMLDPNFKPKVELDITPSSYYTVGDEWTDTKLTLHLAGDQAKWADVTGEATQAIKMLKIDTGGGFVDLPSGGVEIAVVHADKDDTICEDSCFYANDGSCDEPQHGGGVYGGGWYYDDDANWYMDDDYGSGYNYAGYKSTYAYDYGYSEYSDDQYYGVAACEPGTDCTDCGLTVVPDGTCENTCQWARDGFCDDPRVVGVCQLGTDCQDCGPVGKDNFTDQGSAYSTTGWYTDDDSAFLWDDDKLLEGQETNAIPVHKRTFQDHVGTHKSGEGGGELFIDVLWAIVILVGGSVSLGFCMLVYRHFKGQPAVYLPVSQDEGMEMQRRGRDNLTPDVVRIG